MADTHFLFEQVLSVLQRAQLDLSLLVLQLGIGDLEIGDEVIEGLEHLLDGQGDQGSVLNAQTVQVSVGGVNRLINVTKSHTTLSSDAVELSINQWFSTLASQPNAGSPDMFSNG